MVNSGVNSKADILGPTESLKLRIPDIKRVILSKIKIAVFIL